MRRCHHCGQEWTDDARPSYHATCAKCDAYVYVCLNCRFYDPNASGECQLSTTEPVRRKDHPNFCEEFKFADRPAAWPPADAKQQSAAAKARFDALFGRP